MVDETSFGEAVPVQGLERVVLQHERELRELRRDLDWVVDFFCAHLKIPKHHGGCSNQNTVNRYGAYIGAEGCDCQPPQPWNAAFTAGQGRRILDQLHKQLPREGADGVALTSAPIQYRSSLHLSHWSLRSSSCSIAGMGTTAHTLTDPIKGVQ